MYKSHYNKSELQKRKNEVIRRKLREIQQAIPEKKIVEKPQEKINPKHITTKPLGQVETFDYASPIKYFLNKVEKESDVGYYKNLLSIANKLEEDTLVMNNNKNLFNIFLHYLYFNKDITAIVLWPISSACLKNNGIGEFKINKETFFYKELELHGTIHGIVHLNLTSKQMLNFIYQVYFNNAFIKTVDKLKKKLSRVKNNNEINSFYVIFYETDKKINGKNASFKQHLRGLIQRRLRINNSSNTLLHATDNFTEMIEMAKLLLPNSIDSLKYQSIEPIINNILIRDQLLKFKREMYKLSLFKQELVVLNRDFIDQTNKLKVNQYDTYLEDDDYIEKSTRVKYLDSNYFYYFIGLKFMNI